MQVRNVGLKIELWNATVKGCSSLRISNSAIACSSDWQLSGELTLRFVATAISGLNRPVMVGCTVSTIREHLPDLVVSQLQCSLSYRLTKHPVYFLKRYFKCLAVLQ